MEPFDETDWTEKALLAASAGLHKTSLLPSLLSCIRSPELPGGNMSGNMGTDVGNGTWCSVKSPNTLVASPDPQMQSAREMFRLSAKLHPNAPCMGSRQVLNSRRDDSGETKLTLGEYTWMTYEEAHRKATNFGKGLRSLGVNPGAMINFFADTSPEWQLACQGCLDQGIVVTTTYTNLGEEAVSFAIQQAEVETIFTDARLATSVLPGVLVKCPLVKRVVYIAPRELGQAPPQRSLFPDNVELLSFAEVCENGARNAQIETPELSRDDLAVLMYTSGSTARPKGVLISNGNLLAVVAGASNSVPQFGPRDSFLCYLPCAHILEMVVELCCLNRGAALGYGTPKTLSNASPHIDAQSHTVGDAVALRPTLLAAVPMVFDKLRSAVMYKVDQVGGVKAKLFNHALAKKIQAVEQGRGSPLWDLLVFDKLRTQVLGGRVRFMLCGGGPLSRATQLFMNAVFNCPVGQGYGATETTGIVTTCWPNDRFALGKVGAPITCSQIRLEDWSEGGYFASDKPFPRGEILVGGPHISQGYFKLEEKTAECFFVDELGVRWFRTEDIGQVWPNGTLSVIDRKKDLVKLSGGEYVSYGKLEPLARDSEYVDNCFFYANPLKSFVVAVVTVKPHLVHNPPSDDVVRDDVVRHMRDSGVCVNFEYPKRVLVVTDAWTPENDLVTAAMKLKRFRLEKKYEDVLKDMCEEEEGKAATVLS